MDQLYSETVCVSQHRSLEALSRPEPHIFSSIFLPCSRADRVAALLSSLAYQDLLVHVFFVCVSKGQLIIKLSVHPDLRNLSTREQPHHFWQWAVFHISQE